MELTMAKGGAKPAVSVKPPKTFADVENTDLKVYTSTKGVKIPLRAVSQFKIDAMRSSREEVPVPTYEADVFGGDKETLELDAEIAKSQGREKEWKEYLAAVEQETRVFGILFNTMVVSEGVDLDAPGPDSDWQRSCDKYKLKIPEDPIDRKVFYINTELLGAFEEMGDLMTAIFAASKFSQEVIAKMKGTFRSAVERKKDPGLAPETVGVADQ
jgi:hypothetical protein